eukprot:1008768_1
MDTETGKINMRRSRKTGKLGDMRIKVMLWADECMKAINKKPEFIKSAWKNTMFPARITGEDDHLYASAPVKKVAGYLRRKQREMMIYVDYETQQCIWRFCSDHEIVCVAAQLKNYMHDADFIIIEDPTLNPLLSEIEFGEEVERRLERIDNLKEYEETVNRRRNHNK